MGRHKYFRDFMIGAVLYSLTEILWRGYTHWTMTLTGGFCFTLLNKIYKKMGNCNPFKKCICGSIIITASEFLVGITVNKIFKLKVWDYTKKKFNIGGQICLLYSFLWALLCIPVTFVCNFINKKT